MGRIAGLVVVTAVLAAIAPGRFGGHHRSGGEALRWETPARVSALAGTASDHLLFGRVVNHSGRTLRLRAADVRVLDRDGHALRTAAAFADGFVPGVTLRGYGAEVYGADPSVTVGRVVVLRTGQSAPLTASFTAPHGARPGAVELGAGRLKIG